MINLSCCPPDRPLQGDGQVTITKGLVRNDVFVEKLSHKAIGPIRDEM